MKLIELMNYEEKLLKYFDENQFNISFQQYLDLSKTLEYIESITNKYFILLKGYDKKLIMDNISDDERRIKLTEFNDKILSSEVIVDKEIIINI
jgi:hypothetical protein